jgi:hypothetical protein
MFCHCAKYFYFQEYCNLISNRTNNLIAFIILFFVVTGLVIANRWVSRTDDFSTFDRWFLQGLLLYHLFFAWLFYEYILFYGGDALRYWQLTAEPSMNSDKWMGYFGTGTKFIQWINYIPSKSLGVSFLVANLAYGCFSFLGIQQLYLLTRKIIPLKLNNKGNYLLALVFLLPNLHFWTSGVGKESLMFVGIILILLSVTKGKDFWFYGIFGAIFLFLIRPVSGLIGISIWFGFLLFSDQLKKQTIGFISFGIFVLMLGMFYWVLEISHLQEFSWDGLIGFRKGQFEFLKTFNAATEVPMEEYSLLYQLWTLLFRPFWFDFHGFWSFAAILENTVSLILILVGIFAIMSSPRKKNPAYLKAGLLMLAIMTGIHLFNLNNLGLMMRMKSTLMIFLHLAAAIGIISKWKYYNCVK